MNVKENIFQDQRGYNFSYQVTGGGAEFGHSEQSLADVTRGSYRVLLSDGRLQSVQYTVNGGTGFKASVNYGGSEPDSGLSMNSVVNSHTLNSVYHDSPSQTFPQPHVPHPINYQEYQIYKE